MSKTNRNILIYILIIIIVISISAVILCIFNIIPISSTPSATIITPVPTSAVSAENTDAERADIIYSDKIRITNDLGELIPAREDLVSSNIKTTTENGEETSLHVDTFGASYRHDENLLSSLYSTNSINDISILCETDKQPYYSIYAIENQSQTFLDLELINSGTVLILPTKKGEYLLSIAIKCIENESSSSYNCFIKYRVDTDNQGIGEVIAYDDDNTEIIMRKEFMWSETAVADDNGTISYLCADGGQLGFLNKEEMIESLYETTSIKEIEITNDPWSTPTYTVYDLSYPVENINLVGSNDDSVVHHGENLILPEKIGEYIVGITVVWSKDNSKTCYKYFFKYIIES